MNEMWLEVPDESEQLDQLQPGDTLDDRGVADTLDEGYSPPERASHLTRYGEHESLAQRLSEEEPEVWQAEDSDDYLDDGEVGGRRAGRLAESDGGFADHKLSDMYAADVGIDGAGASAEEAAMHIVGE